jgi:hypothetical protein
MAVSYQRSAYSQTGIKNPNRQGRQERQGNAEEFLKPPMKADERQ